jgi:hypothetical protein
LIERSMNHVSLFDKDFSAFSSPLNLQPNRFFLNAVMLNQVGNGDVL